MRPWLSILLLAPLASQSLAQGGANAPVVINEFCYDDSGSDDYEFVELYNASRTSVDISGWKLESADPLGPNAGYTIPKGTVLAPGGFWVIGTNRVPAVDQVAGSGNLWENSNESLTLVDANGKVVDTLVYEANKGYWPGAKFETEGVWGNFTGIQPAGVFTAILRGRNEVPPVRTQAVGRAVVRLDAATRRVTIRAQSNGAMTTTAAHLHQAAAGSNGPVIVPLKQVSKDPDVWEGSAVLTPAQVSALQAGGTYVNFHSARAPAGEIRGQALPLPTTSWQRKQDGLDTGNNGYDFVIRPSTPGISNAPLGPKMPYKPDFDKMAPETILPEWGGTFAGARVIDPTKVSKSNPNAIPASPQGGNAVVFWDNSGGGNHNMLIADVPRDGTILAWVYFDANLAPAGQSQTWTIGFGSTGTFYNIPDPSGSLGFTANGNTGLAFTYQVTDKAATLYVVEHHDGGWGTGAKTKPRVVGKIDIKKGVNDGWRQLRLDINRDRIFAAFGDCVSNTAFPARGKSWILERMPRINNVYVSYREALTDNSKARPPTLDKIEIGPCSGNVEFLGQLTKTGAGREPIIHVNSAPVVGNANWAITMSNLPPRSIGVLYASRRRRFPPLDIGAAGGQPGSFLYVDEGDNVNVRLQANSDGSTLHLRFVPCHVKFVGTTIYLQYFGVDPTIKAPLPVFNTKAMAVTFGS